MEHSISDVARMAGVTSRTLRHYDDIGILHPARAATNGYRWYGRPELLRLQRILLLRELRVPLPQIQQVLDGDTDELASLRRHREDLAAERDRLEQIITTVERTIVDLCGTEALTDEEFFTGLATRRQALRNDLKSRYGDSVDDHFTSAAQATAGWTDRTTSTPPSKDVSSCVSFPTPAPEVLPLTASRRSTSWSSTTKGYEPCGQQTLPLTTRWPISSSTTPISAP